MREAAEKFGSQCIVVAIDAKKVSSPGERDRWEIFTHGGRKPTGIDAVAFARQVAALGAGEILVTSMDRDGTKAGYDIALTRAIADAVPVPVIASGGVGTLDHLVEGVRDGHASAVLAASIFHFGDLFDRRGQGAHGAGRACDAARIRTSAATRRPDAKGARPPSIAGRNELFTIEAATSPSPTSPASSPSAPRPPPDRILHGEAPRRRAGQAAKKLGEEAVEAVIAAVRATAQTHGGGRRRALSSAGRAAGRATFR